MKSRLLFLIVTAWLALSLVSCSADHPSLAETRTKAEQGGAKAQFNLGLMYRQGQGVPKDDAEAVKWYRKATEQGFAGAQTNLGLMYNKGEGVPRDDIEAYMWASLAAAQGHEKAKVVLDSIGRGMTPDQIAEARKRVAIWQPAHSKQ